MSASTRRLTAAGAIVEFLKRQYVERDGARHRLVNGVFGIFGHGNVTGLGQALDDYGGEELPYHQPKNEQAMVHTAVAFAKARRGLGTFACTSSVGPGATNMVTGAATATINRLPVLLLPGDIFANRQPAPVLQQLEFPASMDVSVNDCFRPVSRYWDRINRPEQLLAALPEAMRVMADPATAGAVTLALPEDVQAEAFDYPRHFFEERVYRIARLRADRDGLAAAAEMIRRARRPFIVAGGGVYYSEAEPALRAFVEKTHVPVGVTQAGKGVLPDAYPYCLGGLGTTGTLAANRIAQGADLVLVLGSRLSDFTTASKTQFQDPAVRFVSVNVSAYDAHKHGALPLVGDARAILEDLGEALSGYRIADAYEREIRSAREEWDRVHGEILHPRRDGGLLHQAEVILDLSQFTRTYLREAYLVSLSKNVLTIGFPPQVEDHLGLVDNARNHLLLQTKLLELGYSNVQIKFVKAEMPPERCATLTPKTATPTPTAAPKLAEPAGPIPPATTPLREKLNSVPFNKDEFKNDPLIQKALEMFKGQIVEVRA